MAILATCVLSQRKQKKKIKEAGAEVKGQDKRRKENKERTYHMVKALVVVCTELNKLSVNSPASSAALMFCTSTVCPGTLNTFSVCIPIFHYYFMFFIFFVCLFCYLQFS